MNGTFTDSNVLVRLKSETRTAHDDIEAVLDLMSDRLTLASYRQTLERFYGFYSPLEAKLDSAGAGTSMGLRLCERQKRPLLDADLRALGSAPNSLPACSSLPPHASTAAAYGCLYVLEGASLGGLVISRHVRRVLGLTPERGGRFFHGYGERSSAMWQSFRSALAGFADTSQKQDEVVAAAIATFSTLHRWCRQESIG